VYRFRPAQRLLEAKAFSAVFARRRVLRNDPFELYFRPAAEGISRLGLVVPKRYARRAVQRNLIKRLAREAFRHSSPELPAMDIVLRLGRPLNAEKSLAGAQARRQWRSRIDELLRRAAAMQQERP